MKDEAAWAAAFINRETGGDVSSSAAGRGREKKLAAAHRYDQQHVDKLASIDTVSKSDADASSSSSSSSWGAEIMLWSDKRVFGLTAGH